MPLFEIQTTLGIILDTFFVAILLFQLFYIIETIIIIIAAKSAPLAAGSVNEKISIVIPLFNSENTIDKCLDSVLQNDLSLINSLIIILDHCDDGSGDKACAYEEKFKKLGINFLILNLPDKVTGKVNAIKHGIGLVETKNILLVDADIILKKDAINKLLNFHLSNNNSFSSCLVYPYQQTKNSFISRIICQDRLYRQNIVKTVKNKYGVANFPGSVGIVNVEKYKKFLFSGFLEDLTASFHIMGVEEKIVILPLILAYELERESLKGLFFQRVRWSIGNIENIPLLIKTIRAEKSWFKKFLMASYPLMWYVQHYVIILGIILALFFAWKLIWLLPLILYFSQILISDILARKNYNCTLLEIIGHCLLFPFIITAALVGGIILILRNKKLYFRNKLLFKRI